jgi:hypothetical protein
MCAHQPAARGSGKRKHRILLLPWSVFASADRAARLCPESCAVFAWKVRAKKMEATQVTQQLRTNDRGPRRPEISLLNRLAFHEIHRVCPLSQKVLFARRTKSTNTRRVLGFTIHYSRGLLSEQDRSDSGELRERNVVSPDSDSLDARGPC